MGTTYKLTADSISNCNLYIVNSSKKIQVTMNKDFTPSETFTSIEIIPSGSNGNIIIENLKCITYTESNTEENIDFDFNNLQNTNGYTFKNKTAHSFDTTYKTGNKGLFISGLSIPSGNTYTLKCDYISSSMYMTIRPSDWSSQILIRSTDFVNNKYTFTADKDYGLLNFGADNGDGSEMKITNLYLVNNTTGFVENAESIDLSTVISPSQFTVNSKTSSKLDITVNLTEGSYKIKSYIGEDILVPNGNFSNFENGYFKNNGTVCGYCTSDAFKTFNEISIITKLKVVESKPWVPIVSFGDFRLMQQDNLKFNLITSQNGNPAWTTNVPMNEFTLNKDIEVA